MHHKKLIIVTAQFGMKYGIANKKGIPSDNETIKIFNTAKSRNINFIDTAIAYGNCERRLGELLDLKNYKVITKINNDIFYDLDSITKIVKSSCNRMRTNSLNTVLLHGLSNSKELNQNNLNLLEILKNKETIKRVGISIYNEVEFDEILNNFQIDVIQFPLNILNRNSFRSFLFKEAKSRNIEIHARSIFLQGLLLMEKDKRPPYFKEWSSLFEKWDRWIINEEVNPIEACLSFAFHNKYIDKVVIGIDSYSHLKSIVGFLDDLEIITPPKNLFSFDKNLTDPSKWKF